MSKDASLILIDDPVRHVDGEGARGPEGRRLRPMPYTEPALTVLNLGLVRGDGIFETVSVVDGAIQAADAHQARFLRSARMLDLPDPDVEVFRGAILTAAEDLEQVSSSTQILAKVVMTRGREALEPGAPSPEPVGWVLAWVPEGLEGPRVSGRDLVTLNRGLPLGVGESAPWLLVGAKTLSYAVNQAVTREARRRGADDALLTTSDGYVLEGPTWNVVLLIDGVAVTPRPEGGLLPGTTQRDVFRALEARGVRTEHRDVRVEELERATSAWMTGSGIYAVPVRHLDRRELAVDDALTAGLNADLAARRS